jgi:hypothetical protein
MPLTPISRPLTQSSNLQLYIDPDVDDEKQNVDDKNQRLDLAPPSKPSNVQKPDEPQQKSTKSNTIAGKALLKLETAWDNYVRDSNAAASDSDDATYVLVSFDDVQKTYLQAKTNCEKLIEAIENSRDRAGLCWTVGWTAACLDPDQRKSKADLRFRLNTLDNIHETINFIEDAAKNKIDLEISDSTNCFYTGAAAPIGFFLDSLSEIDLALSSLLRNTEDCNLALKALGSSKIAQISSSEAKDVDKSIGFEFSGNEADQKKILAEMSKDDPKSWVKKKDDPKSWVKKLYDPTFPPGAGKAIKYYCSLLISVREFLDKYKYQLGDLNPSQALIYFQTYQSTFEIEEKLKNRTEQIANGSFSAEDMDFSDDEDAYNLTIKHMVATLEKNLPEPTKNWDNEQQFIDDLEKLDASINYLHQHLIWANKGRADLRFLQRVLAYADVQINNLSKIAPEKSELVEQMRSDLKRATKGLIKGNLISYRNTTDPIDIRQVINLGLRANAAREDILHKKQKEQQNNVAVQQSICSPMKCVIL